MTDEHSGLPADVLQGDGRRPCRRRRRTSARTCGAPSPPSGSGSSATTSSSGGAAQTLTTLEHMERHAPSGQFYNWYDHRDGRQAHDVAADRRAAGPDPLLRRQRLAGDRAADRRQRVPELARAPRAIYDSMDFGFYYVPERNRILFHYSPAHRAPARAATTRSSRRAGSPTTSGSPRASCRARPTTGAGDFPDTLRLRVQETRPSGFHRSYDGVPSTRAAILRLARGSRRAGAARCSRR